MGLATLRLSLMTGTNTLSWSSVGTDIVLSVLLMTGIGVLVP